jgi:hypothetical protein
VVAIGVLVGVGVIVLRLSAGDEKPTPAATGVGQQPITGFRPIARPDLGYAVDVPAGWVPAADDSPTTTSYAASVRPTTGSLRVTVGSDASTLTSHVAGLMEALRQQGGTGFVQTPTQISGLAAIRLDYRFPLSPNAPFLTSRHTSYLVKRDSTVFSFQLATTDPNGEAVLFAHIVSSMRLL